MEASAASTDLSAVEPQFRDLLGLAAQAATLPPWRRSLRHRHSGQYLATVRGRGMEYDESRPYQPGDDIRHLDWRVTARTGKPHTKLFREERERPVFVALDFSPAMFFATRGVFKAVLGARIAALLAWRAQQNGDRVGGLLFAPGMHHELPPRRGQAAVVRWLKLIVDSAPGCRAQARRGSHETSLNETLQRLRRLAKPGSLIFLISDFHGFDSGAESELARLALHTDIALVACYDPLEAALPALDRAGSVSDGEDEVVLRQITTTQRDAYAAAFTAEHERLRRFALDHRMSWAAVDTRTDALAAARGVFAA